MTVVHLDPVSNYEKCLVAGGQHTFEITVDELPSLSRRVPPGSAVVVAFEDLAAEMSDGTWYRIARTLNEKRSICLYWRTSPGTYCVRCILPKRQRGEEENP